MNWLFIHSIIGPLVVALPLSVVLVARSIVQRDAARGGRTLAFPAREMARVGIVTLVALASFALWLTLDSRAIALGLRGSFLAVGEIGVSLAIFCLFGAPVLSRLEKAALSSVQREQAPGAAARYRAASLRPRRLSNYLPISLRVFAILISFLALIYVTINIVVAPAGTRLIMPIGYAAIAAIFFLLYEVWIRQEAVGAQVLGSSGDAGPTSEDAERTRRKRVREIFILQNTLALLFSGMALIAIGIRWDLQSGLITGVAFGVVGGIAGGVGCAFALSSEMQERYLRLRADHVVMRSLRREA